VVFCPAACQQCTTELTNVALPKQACQFSALFPERLDQDIDPASAEDLGELAAVVLDRPDTRDLEFVDLPVAVDFRQEESPTDWIGLGGYELGAHHDVGGPVFGREEGADAPCWSATLDRVPLYVRSSNSRKSLTDAFRCYSMAPDQIRLIFRNALLGRRNKESELGLPIDSLGL
jgi:hypothetical protein